jgi:hypothetical protein
LISTYKLGSSICNSADGLIYFQRVTRFDIFCFQTPEDNPIKIVINKDQFNPKYLYGVGITFIHVIITQITSCTFTYWISKLQNRIEIWRFDTTKLIFLTLRNLHVPSIRRDLFTETKLFNRIDSCNIEEAKVYFTAECKSNNF